MGHVEWALWANEQAVVSSLFLFVGSIIGVAGMFPNWQFAAACLPASLLIFLIEWPRSKRTKGSTEARRYQNGLSRVLDAMGPVTRNYFVRFVLLVIVGVPGCFLLPTLVGALCLLIASIIYFVAAVKGEYWQPLPTPAPEKSDHTPVAGIPSVPTMPPPRRDPGPKGFDNVALELDP